MLSLRNLSVGAATVVAALSLAACGSNTSTASSTASETPSATKSMADDKMDDKKSDDKMDDKKSDDKMDDKAGDASAKAGAYMTLDQYKSDMSARAGTKVVYFFNASWCPTCVATDKALNSSGVPAGITVVNIDYDNSQDLREKYGVTYQHTFVQVDKDGKQLKKWSGSADGAAIASEVA